MNQTRANNRKEGRSHEEINHMQSPFSHVHMQWHAEDPGGGEPPEGGGSDLGAWTAGLKDATKEKYHDRLSGAESFDSFVNATFEDLDSRVKKLGDDATPEDIRAYRESVGLPVAADSFNFNTEELGELNEDDTKAITDLAMGASLSQEQADQVYGFLSKLNKDSNDLLEAAKTQLREDSKKQFASKYGNEAEGNLKMAKDVVRNHFGDEFADFLEDTSMGNDFRFLDGMFRFSKMVSEDAMGDSGPRKATKPDGFYGGYGFENTPGQE